MSAAINQNQIDERPLACDLTAIPAERRAGHQALAARLFGEAAEERRELPDGYAWRFPAERYPDVAAFVADERRCCPFLAFALTLAPDGGPLWLHLTGGGPIKLFLQAELGIARPAELPT
jgi:hypothetical protein